MDRTVIDALVLLGQIGSLFFLCCGAVISFIQAERMNRDSERAKQ